MQPGPPRSVADEIARRIHEGHVSPGARLPSERQLARELGVSRPMVREALRRLAERGLVQVQPGRGTFVARGAPLAPLQHLDSHYRRRGATARQLSEARIMLESETASLAATRATPEQLLALREALEVLEASPTPLDTVRNDLAFHLAVARAANNPVIESMLSSIAGLTAELIVRTVGDEAIRRRSAPYHREAYEAIARRDPEAAREAMRTHLSVASVTYGADYDRPLDTMATRALRLLGADHDLESFLQAMQLPAPKDH